MSRAKKYVVLGLLGNRKNLISYKGLNELPIYSLNKEFITQCIPNCSELTVLSILNSFVCNCSCMQCFTVLTAYDSLLAKHL